MNSFNKLIQQGLLIIYYYNNFSYPNVSKIDPSMFCFVFLSF